MTQHETLDVATRQSSAESPTSKGEMTVGGTGSSVAVRSPDSLMQRLVDATSNPDFDMDKLKQLRELYDAAVQDQRRLAFNAAMVACQKEIPVIKANKRNPDTNSLYASLDAMATVLTPLYTRHGLFVSFGMDTAQIEGCYGVTALVGHHEGYERQFRADIPIDRTGKAGTVNKTGTHAFGSTASYAQRYLLKLIFNVAIEGEDKDGNQPGAVITAEQLKELRHLINVTATEETAYVERGLKLKSLEELPAKRFNDARTLLIQDARQRGTCPPDLAEPVGEKPRLKPLGGKQR